MRDKLVILLRSQPRQTGNSAFLLPRAAETKSLAAHGASLGQDEGQTSTGLTIYYTLDGTDPRAIGAPTNDVPPSLSARKYTGPILIDEPTTRDITTLPAKAIPQSPATGRARAKRSTLCNPERIESLCPDSYKGREKRAIWGSCDPKNHNPERSNRIRCRCVFAPFRTCCGAAPATFVVTACV